MILGCNLLAGYCRLLDLICFQFIYCRRENFQRTRTSFWFNGPNIWWLQVRESHWGKPSPIHSSQWTTSLTVPEQMPASVCECERERNWVVSTLHRFADKRRHCDGLVDCLLFGWLIGSSACWQRVSLPLWEGPLAIFWISALSVVTWGLIGLTASPADLPDQASLGKHSSSSILLLRCCVMATLCWPADSNQFSHLLFQCRRC